MADEASDERRTRFLLALGAVGYVDAAAEMAGVELPTAWAWATAVERPPWVSRRREAARVLFTVGVEALVKVLGRLRSAPEAGETAKEGTSGGGLRELMMVAERCLALALRLDKDVAADDDGQVQPALDTWSCATPLPARVADAASGAARRD